MAIWQYDFYVVPKHNLGIKELDNEDDSFDDSFFWGASTTIDAFLPLTEILEELPSWSENLRIFGDNFSNRVEILTKDKQVISVLMRVDFTSNLTELLPHLVEFLRKNHFALISNDLKPVPLSAEDIVAVISKSKKFQTYRLLNSPSN